MPFTVTLDGDWSKHKQAARRAQTVLPKRIEVFLRREAEIMRAMVIQGYDAQGAPTKWPKLSPWTIAYRRLRRFTGTKALVWSGEMRKSITTTWDPTKQAAFCGILYQTKSKTGRSMVNIAKIHEYGSKPIVIKITPRMRRFLAVLAKYLPGGARSKSRSSGASRSAGVLVIRIPPRPFMRPPLPAFRAGAPMRVQKFFARVLFEV